MFADAAAEGELSSTAMGSEILFRDLMDSFETTFARAETKDEVDQTETDLTKSFRNNYSFRMNELNNVVNTHNMEGLPRIDKLREQYQKDFERINARIGQLADKRKA